jgi:hypothetical protein
MYIDFGLRSNLCDLERKLDERLHVYIYMYVYGCLVA